MWKMSVGAHKAGPTLRSSDSGGKLLEARAPTAPPFSPPGTHPVVERQLHELPEPGSQDPYLELSTCHLPRAATQIHLSFADPHPHLRRCLKSSSFEILPAKLDTLNDGRLGAPERKALTLRSDRARTQASLAIRSTIALPSSAEA